MYAFKRWFFEAWAILFNIIISVYIGIFLRPTVLDVFSAIADTWYNTALAILIPALAVFLILQGISFTLFGQFTIPFPKLFDTLGAGILGFLAGLLLWSFVGFLICITPVHQNKFVKTMDFAGCSNENKAVYLLWWSDFVNTFASSSSNPYTSEEIINQIYDEIEERKNAEIAKREQLQKKKTTETEDTKNLQQPTIEQELGTPPEPNFDAI